MPNSSSPKSEKFEIHGVDGRARTGVFSTHHGVFATPAFMPVGTQGTVKGVTPRDLKELGAQIILSNTYHLHVRPGDELIRDLGGLHRFCGWDGPILTDSGGYQVFSLPTLRKVEESGVTFRSHLDGTELRFTPERVVQIQENLGVDIMMMLDECLPYPATESATADSLALTNRWGARAIAARRDPRCALFGIVQGGMFPHLRKRAAEELCALPFDGFALGGLSVGEPPELLHEMVESSAPLLPPEKIHYLMGVGTPSDIVRAVGNGIDLFDCVIPTRSARFGRVYTRDGHINVKNAQYRTDPNPIEIGCECYTCRHFSLAYLSHLIHAKEVLAIHLATSHNLFFYQRLMREIREAIAEQRFSAYANEVLRREADSGAVAGMNPL